MSESALKIESEIGRLQGVILHTPGTEIERMTPENAHAALYSDILNLPYAQKEYADFRGALENLTQTYQFATLLEETLNVEGVIPGLIDRICETENVSGIKPCLQSLSPKSLAVALIEGVEHPKGSKERFALKPLYNLFFTRDINVVINEGACVAHMANQVRSRESLLVETVFTHHPLFQSTAENIFVTNKFDVEATVEGGDVLIANDHVILVGTGVRTNKKGIDALVQRMRKFKNQFEVIVQELPEKPDSFIHLDMVFTFLDKNCCMVFEPLIMQWKNYKTTRISVSGDQTKFIEETNLLTALKNVGFDLKPIYCGGTSDEWHAHREQWHSGANFFAVAPGQVLGYARNIHTLDELNRHGFDIINARDIASKKVVLAENQKAVIAVDAAELPRGGGGCRCMTMPIKRETINW